MYNLKSEPDELSMQEITEAFTILWDYYEEYKMYKWIKKQFFTARWMLGKLVNKFFFPKWLQVLSNLIQSWLPNYDEIIT